MKTVVGKILLNGDYITVELKDGKKVHVNEVSFGSRKIVVGEKVSGVIINGKFNLETEIQKMIYELFRLCDGYVELKHFVQFEDEFSKVVKDGGYDLHQIYYGKSYDEMKAKYARYRILDPKTRKEEQAKINKAVNNLELKK